MGEAKKPKSVCSLEEAPLLVTEDESIANMSSVAALRWLYSITKPAFPDQLHPWGAYSSFLNKIDQSVAKRLQLPHVLTFLQSMMAGSKIIFWCVDEANLASQEEVSSMLVCV